MVLLLCLGWYLIGFLSTLFIVRFISGETTINDLLISLTLGGVSGLISLFTGLYVLIEDKWGDKKLF